MRRDKYQGLGDEPGRWRVAGTFLIHPKHEAWHGSMTRRSEGSQVLSNPPKRSDAICTRDQQVNLGAEGWQVPFYVHTQNMRYKVYQWLGSLEGRRYFLIHPKYKPQCVPEISRCLFIHPKYEAQDMPETWRSGRSQVPFNLPRRNVDLWHGGVLEGTVEHVAKRVSVTLRCNRGLHVPSNPPKHEARRVLETWTIPGTVPPMTVGTLSVTRACSVPQTSLFVTGYRRVYVQGIKAGGPEDVRS